MVLIVAVSGIEIRIVGCVFRLRRTFWVLLLVDG